MTTPVKREPSQEGFQWPVTASNDKILIEILALTNLRTACTEVTAVQVGS